MNNIDKLQRYLVCAVICGIIVYAIDISVYDYMIDINPLERTIHDMKTQALLQRIVLISKVLYALVIGAIIYKTTKIIKGDGK